MHHQQQRVGRLQRWMWSRPHKPQRVSKKEPPATCQSKEPPAKGQSKNTELSFGFMGVVTPTPPSSLALQVASVNVTEEAVKATVLYLDGIRFAGKHYNMSLAWFLPSFSDDHDTTMELVYEEHQRASTV